MSTPRISIIVPVLNEGGVIRSFLRDVREKIPDAEVIVVDGGSDDGTPKLCTGRADRVLSAARGRARQMNAGAAVARGDVFWFLHADSMIPAAAAAEIGLVLDEETNVGGCFRLRLPGREWIYRISDSLGNIGVSIFGFALGDHGIFCRRAAFERVGGFPDVPLMEDAEFYRALRRLGKMRQVPSEIMGNQRRYEELGPYRTTGYYIIILALYLGGVRIATLMSIYRRLTGGRPDQLPPAMLRRRIAVLRSSP